MITQVEAQRNMTTTWVTVQKNYVFHFCSLENIQNEDYCLYGIRKSLDFY